MATGTLPELGPLLGRLVQPDVHLPGGLSLEAARVGLVSRLFAAAGAAREALAGGDAPAARAHLRAAAWLDAWHGLSAEVAEVVVQEARKRLTEAAALVRMPTSTLARYLPGPEESTLIRHRLDAAAIPLERVSPPETADDVAAGMRAAALAVDASWDRLVAVVSEEMTRVTAQEQAILAWQRPRHALWAVTGVVLLAALLAGLWSGGYLTSPPPAAPWGGP